MSHATTNKDAPTAAPRKRRFLRALVLLVVLGVAVIALLPTILSFGPAASAVRSALREQVNGEVDVRAVRLGWLGAQSIEQLVMRDASGANVITVDATLDEGLLGLILSGGSDVRLTIAGSAKGTFAPGGENGLSKLFDTSATRSGAGASSSGSGSSGAGSQPPANVRATLNIAGFTLSLTDTSAQRSYTLDGLKGSATFDGGAGTVVAKLDSGTDFLGGKGSVSVAADVRNIGGTVKVGAIAADVTVDGKNIRVPVDDRTADFSQVTVKVSSPGLAQSATISAKAEGSLDGSTASSLVADLAIDRPLADDGSLRSSPAALVGAIKGSVVATRLPTSLAQPALAATSIVLPKDLGATIESLTITAPGGGTEPITVALKAPKAEITATALVTLEGAVRNASLDGTLEAAPETLQRLAKTDVSDVVRVAINGRNVSWSPPVAGGNALASLVGTLTVQPASPIVWRAPDGKMTAAIGQGGAIGLGRATVGESFVAECSLAVGVGGATGATAPSAPNLVARTRISETFDAISETSMTLAAELPPAFVEAVAQQTLTQPARLNVEVRALNTAIPPSGAAGIAADIVVRLDGENAMYIKELSRDVRFADIVATLTSPDAAKGGTLQLTGQIDRGAVDVQQAVGPLPADFKGFDPLALDARGTIRLTGLQGAALMAWLPEQRPLIEAAGIRDLTVDIRNEPLPGRPGQRLATQLSGEPVRGDVVAGVSRESVRIDKLALTGTITKELVAKLQASNADPVRVADAIPFALTLDGPVTAAFSDLAAGKLPEGLAARLTVPQVLVAAAPGLASGLALKDIAVQASVDASGSAAKAQGSFSAQGTTSVDDRLDKATFELAWARKTGPSLLKGLAGDVKLSGISVPWIETLLGKDRNALSTWVGSNGDLTLTMEETAGGESVRLVPAFPRIAGTLDVLARGEAIEVATNGLSVRVNKEALTELATKPVDDAARSTRYLFASEFVAQVTAGNVKLPRALACDGFSLAGASIDCAVDTQPLAINVETAGKAPGRLDMPALRAKATSRNLADGIAFTLNDHGTAPGAGPSPAIAVTGALKKVLDAQSKFDAKDATLDLDAQITKLPSVFVDLVGATGGTVARSLGESIDLSAKAAGLSATAGQLALKMTAPHAEVDAPSIVVRDGLVSITQDKPITGSFELSPGIKEDILYVINPIFADVDIAAKRATLNIPALAYPIDGRMERFNGDVNFSIGDIRFKSGQPISIVMEVLRRNATDLEGRIEPLALKVTNGVMTYKDFGVRFGRIPEGWKTALNMQGSIDLTKKPIFVNEITTRVPANQVANFSSDVRQFFELLGGTDSDLVKSLSIGLTFYGPLYDAQGRRAKLQVKAALPEIGDLIKKNPDDLLKEGLRIFEGLRKDK